MHGSMNVKYSYVTNILSPLVWLIVIVASERDFFFFGVARQALREEQRKFTGPLWKEEKEISDRLQYNENVGKKVREKWQ